MSREIFRNGSIAVVGALALGWFLGSGLLGEKAEAQSAEKKLKIEYVNPLENMGFTQVVVTTHGGVRTIRVSGQVGRGETMEAQATTAFEALKNQLEAAGAAPADVVKLNTYIVGYSTDDLPGFSAGKNAVFGGLEHQPASTLVGVEALVYPNFRIEIEAIAVVEE